jgi:hypothetical protein
MIKNHKKLNSKLGEIQMSNQIAIDVLKKEIEEIKNCSKYGNSVNQVKEIQKNFLDHSNSVKFKKLETSIFFRWNDGTLGSNQTVKVASMTFEETEIKIKEITLIDACRLIYSATENAHDSWVEREQDITLHVPAKNENGITLGSSYVSDIITITATTQNDTTEEYIFEVADYGFNRLTMADHSYAIEEFQHEVMFGRDEEKRHGGLSFDARARREGYTHFEDERLEKIRKIEKAIDALKE